MVGSGLCAASLDRCSAKPARDSSTQEQSTDRDEENGAYSSKCDSRVSDVHIRIELWWLLWLCRDKLTSTGS